MLRRILDRLCPRPRRRPEEEQEQAEICKGRAAFATQYPKVLSACRLLTGQGEIAPEHLARQYMSRVLRETDAAWWAENRVYLTDAWFVYEYACSNGLLTRREQQAQGDLNLFVIRPEHPSHPECVYLRALRRPAKTDCGKVVLRYVPDDTAFFKLIQRMGFESQKGRSVQTVGEAEAPIEDRVVEIAVELLQNGYPVCVNEPALHRRILAGEYEPMHRYWVVEGASIDLLELKYPWDKQLHEYVYRAGARWDGKKVEISICHSHMLDDVLRLYGFRVTAEAQRRMDAWREVRQNAAIYRPRRRKENISAQPLLDQFRQMLKERPQIIEDLYENDE